MEEGTPPRFAELHAELYGLTLGQLLEKAELLEVDDETLDDAEDEQEVIAMIMAKLEERVARLKEELGSMKLRHGSRTLQVREHARSGTTLGPFEARSAHFQNQNHARRATCTEICSFAYWWPEEESLAALRPRSKRSTSSTRYLR